jgi:lipopolysaccharide transport system permease protein
MPQTARIPHDSDDQRLRPDARPDGHDAAHPANRQLSVVAAARPTTILRAPSFSLVALGQSVRRLFHYRDLLFTLSVHRLNVRYKQSVLGPAWALLQPLALMLIYTVIFSRIVRVPTNGAPYAIFAYSALLPWTYFSTALSSATNSLVSHFSLVTKVYFPREILPLTYVVAALVDFLVASILLGLMLVYYQVPLTANVLYAFPALAVLTMFAIAISLLLCAIQVRYRDIGVAMPLAMQLWMFATPVVYPLSLVPARWRSLYILNPMVGIIETFRRGMLEGKAPDFQALAMSTVVSLLLLPIAYIYFKRVEATVADII